jgi:hypothetical protein
LDFQKPLTGPQDPLLKPLAKELACSYKVQTQLLQWLYDNKVNYWDNAVNFVAPKQFVLFGYDLADLGISLNDFPELNDVRLQDIPWVGDVSLANLTQGWEGKVTYKLIELIKNDKLLGPLCGVPYVQTIHKMPLQQNYRENFCTRTMIPLLPISLGVSCKDYFRTPY